MKYRILLTLAISASLPAMSGRSVARGSGDCCCQRQSGVRSPRQALRQSPQHPGGQHLSGGNAQGRMIPRDMWQWGVRPEIQKWLKEHDPKQKIRCLVTMWGVPLKIGPATPDAGSKAYQAFLEGERAIVSSSWARSATRSIRWRPKASCPRDALPSGGNKTGEAKAVQGDAGKAPLFQSTETGDKPAGDRLVPPGQAAPNARRCPADRSDAWRKTGKAGRWCCDPKIIRNRAASYRSGKVTARRPAAASQAAVGRCAQPRPDCSYISWPAQPAAAM